MSVNIGLEKTEQNRKQTLHTPGWGLKDSIHRVPLFLLSSEFIKRKRWGDREMSASSLKGASLEDIA